MGSEALPLDERLRRGDVFAVDCPSRVVMRHLTSSWGVLVMIVLQSGTHRFSALRRKVRGVSERMLAQTLRSLEGDGLVERTSFAVVPPHVEYNLTPLGREAAEKVAALAEWIETNLPRLLVKRAGLDAGTGAKSAVLPVDDQLANEGERFDH